MLAELYQGLSTARESSDSAVRVLSGEQVAPTDMSMGGDGLDAAPMGDELGAAPDSDLDADTDGFDATDAAAGGEEELGRERR